MTLFIDNASFEKERLLHCVIAMRRVTRYTVYSVRATEEVNKQLKRQMILYKRRIKELELQIELLEEENQRLKENR